MIKEILDYELEVSATQEFLQTIGASSETHLHKGTVDYWQNQPCIDLETSMLFQAVKDSGIRDARLLKHTTFDDAATFLELSESYQVH